MKKHKTKSSWNYRVLAYKHKYAKEASLNIYEVYYNEEGVPNGYAEDPATVEGGSIKGFKWTLKHMKKCLKKPILYCGERFPDEYKGEEI